MLPWWLRWWRIYLQCGRPGFDPWVGKILWRREGLPTPVFWPGESHGWRSLAGYGPCSHRAGPQLSDSHLPGQCVLKLLSGVLETDGLARPLLVTTAQAGAASSGFNSLPKPQPHSLSTTLWRPFSLWKAAYLLCDPSP